MLPSHTYNFLAHSAVLTRLYLGMNTCVCICMNICLYTYACTPIWLYIYMHIYISETCTICMPETNCWHMLQVHTYNVSAHSAALTRLYIGTNTHACVCIYIYMYIYIYIYTYICIFIYQQHVQIVCQKQTFSTCCQSTHTMSPHTLLRSHA